MSEEAGLVRPRQIGSSAPLPVDTLVGEFEAVALQEFVEPTYEPVPPIDAYLHQNWSGLAKKIDKNASLGRWRRGQLQRAQDNYVSNARFIDKKNDTSNAKWRSRVASQYVAACALTVLSGDEDTAAHYYDQAETWGAHPERSAGLGLALLLRDNQEQGKSLVLGTDSGSSHVHDLLDAYRWTGDEDYRTALVHELPNNQPYLIGRLAMHDIGSGRDAGDLFELAEARGPRMVVALLLNADQSHGGDEPRYRRFIEETLERWKVPKKKTLHLGDKAAGHLKNDGVFGIIDIAFDTIEEGIDLALGDTQTELSPEYRKWLRDYAPLLARVAPLLRREHYPVQDDGDRTVAAWGKDARVLFVRNSWGDRVAGQQLLNGNSKNALYVYRNLLRDAGPAAAAPYLSKIPKRDRQVARYHTVLAYAMQGAIPSRVPQLETQDTYRPLRALYKQAAETMTTVELRPEAGTPPVTASGIDYELSQLHLLNTAQRQSLLCRIRAMNNPEAETQVLHWLLGRTGE